MTRLLCLALFVGVPACLDGPEPSDDELLLSTSAQEATCLGSECPEGGGESGQVLCSQACTLQESCDARCIDAQGEETTCFHYGTCQRCGTTCGPEADCYEACKTTTGARSTCGAVNQCKKYDVYCAYPVLTEAKLRDNHETGAGGAMAYTYYASASGKIGSYHTWIGGLWFDRNRAWASNFQGPYPVHGETSRTQWEWGDAPSLLWAEYLKKGTNGVPYLFGKGCKAVAPGAPMPTLTAKTEQVYEDDECIKGLCNPDDHVGSFTIDYGACRTAMTAGKDLGTMTGWTAIRDAVVSGDITRVRYKTWCYACKNAWSRSCMAGVEP